MWWWYAIVFSASLAGLVSSQDEPRPPAKTGESKKAAPKADQTSSDNQMDVHKTAERIAENAQKAGERLKEKDPGADTRRIQKDIIDDIDTLIKKSQEPPPKSDMPPPKNDMPPPKGDMTPMGGGGGGAGDPKQKDPMPGGAGGNPQPKSPMGSQGGGGGSQSRAGPGTGSGSDSRPGRRPRRERRPRGDSPMGMENRTASTGAGGATPMPVRPDPKDGADQGKSDRKNGDGDRFGMASPKRQSDKLADLYKDVWGHLPERLRQEMDLYYREKFMSRYSELLRQYYAALAEQKKSGSEDR